MEPTANQGLPVKPGDWVGSKTDPSCTAKVRDVYRMGGEVLVDLVLYSRAGDKVGRESPAMGGPRNYEPACPWKDWQRIEEPDFPLTLEWLSNGEGGRTAGFGAQKVLPERNWTKPEGQKASVRLAARISDYDPKSEAAARRLAAQELRDMGRKHGLDALRGRAEELETEAESISPRGL